MTLRRMLVGVGVLAFVALATGAGTARAQDDEFILSKDGQARLAQLDGQCAGRVLGLSREIESVNRWSNIFLVVGATLAAVGSACAGTLSASASRRIAAVVGACGAIVTVLPKTLKDKDALATAMVHADAHRNFGEKVLNQLDYMRTNGLKRKSVAYVASRFTECMAVLPSEKVPDLPSFGPGDLPVAAPALSTMAVETPPSERALPSPAKVAGKKRAVPSTARARMSQADRVQREAAQEKPFPEVEAAQPSAEPFDPSRNVFERSQTK